MATQFGGSVQKGGGPETSDKNGKLAGRGGGMTTKAQKAVKAGGRVILKKIGSFGVEKRPKGCQPTDQAGFVSGQKNPGGLRIDG